MLQKRHVVKSLRRIPMLVQHLKFGLTLLMVFDLMMGVPVRSFADQPEKAENADTASPIKHVIVIIGENRSFDHVFATYKPRPGQFVNNLLSKGIVKEDGTPGPLFFLASQSSASDTTVYQLNPSKNTPYAVLPPVLAGGYTTAPFPDAATAASFENGLLPEDYVLLTTGGTGLAHGTVDTRVPNATTPAQRPVPVDLGDPSLRRLRQQPCPPLLPDVAAVRLQRRACQQTEPDRMPR